MKDILILILSVALGQFPNTALHEREVAFAELPPECSAEYHAEIREFRIATATLVCRGDLDGDGTDELLIWTGNSGSGGEEWSVMTKRDGRWLRAGQVFGNLHFVDRSPFRGLVVGTPCGWSNSSWEYWELKDGILTCRLAIDMHYDRPAGHILRTRPVEMKIKELP